MTLDELKDILQLANAMRSALNREADDRAVRPEYALIMGCYIADLEVKVMEWVRELE